MPRFEMPWSRFPSHEDEIGVAAKPFRWRLWLAIAVGLLVALVGAGLWLAPQVERNLSARSVRQAQELLRDQDYRRAQLVLEQAVQANPGDFETRRELAKFYEDAGSPRGLVIWRQLVEAEPSNDTDRISYAYYALELSDLASARSALAGVSAAGRATVNFHRASAGAALLAHDQKQLAAEVAELAILEPDNPRDQFNHAAIELSVGGDRAAVRPAVQELVKLARGEPLRIRATLELLRAASRSRAPNYAALAEEILPARRGAAALLSWTAPPRGLLDLIAYMQNQPNPVPEDAALLADWMRRQGLVPEAAFWLNSLDPALRRTPPILSVRAACYVQIRDWRGLEDCLRQGVWGRASDDALDLAFAAHLQRDGMHSEHARDTWNDAIDSAGSSIASLHVLLRLAGEIGWVDATEATLEALVKANPHEATAWDALVAIDIAHGDSEKLLQLYGSWLKAEPSNVVARGGQAWVAGVLGRGGSQGGSSDKLAADPSWTAARALYLQSAGRNQPALDLLAQLPPDAQLDRRVQLVRGIALSESGRPAESEKALAAAATSPLLPQESALLKAARARNHGTGPG